MAIRFIFLLFAAVNNSRSSFFVLPYGYLENLDIVQQFLPIEAQIHVFNPRIYCLTAPQTPLSDYKKWRLPGSTV